MKKSILKHLISEVYNEILKEDIELSKDDVLDIQKAFGKAGLKVQAKHINYSYPSAVAVGYRTSNGRWTIPTLLNIEKAISLYTDYKLDSFAFGTLLVIFYLIKK